MTIITKESDSLNLVAARVFGGDVSRFGEILDLNPDLDVFADLAPAVPLEIPTQEQIENYAQPVLTRIADSAAGARGFLGTVQQTINQVSGSLPSELQGYASEVLDLVGEANGVLDEAETIIEQATDKLRTYGNQTNLISWLLGGKK